MTDPPLIFLATSYEPHCRLVLDKHLDGYHTIQYMERGGVGLAYDDRAYTLEGSWFWPAYPGPRIRFHPVPSHPDWFHRHVGFQGPLVAHWITAGLWPDAPQPAPPGRDWSAFFDQLIAQSRRTDRWGRLRATNLMEQMLLELAEARAQPSPQEAWLSATLDALGQDPAMTTDYADLADTLGMGLSTLRRRFKAAMGISLHRYVLDTRMAQARTLLGETEIPIKAVAEQLGYDNIYFFSRQFRQYQHITPSAYRRSRQS